MGPAEDDFRLAPMRFRYKVSRWAHRVVSRLAWRFAPPNYVQGRATANQRHPLWLLNGWVSRPWIEDWILRSKEARDRREAKEAKEQMEASIGAQMIAAERNRQVNTLGWSAERDDELYPHGNQLALAGAWYAIPDFERSELDERGMNLWPWTGSEPGWWKPTTRTRDLVKAGALIAAAIDLRVRQGLD